MRITTLALISLSVVATTFANETPLTAADAEVQTATLQANANEDVAGLPTAAPIPPNHDNDNDNESSEEELKKRQAAGQIVGAGVPNSPDPTQMSPVTTFMKYGPNGQQTPVVYTQTFAKVPEQWTPPKSGSIGMGDIVGQIGVVKTKVRRNYVAEATAAVKRGIIALEKRKKKGSSGGGGNAASGVTVPLLTVAAALGTGVLALLL